MDGRLEVRRAGVDGFPPDELVSPDPTSVWWAVASIKEAWIAADDRSLVVVGLRGYTTVLHSVEVDESEREVGVVARVAFPLETARSMAQRSEQPGVTLEGVRWCAEVRLQRPLSGRAVVDRGAALRLELADRTETVSGQVLARLQAELAAAATPSERRRIRQMIKAIRRNPLKASMPGEPPGD